MVSRLPDDAPDFNPKKAPPLKETPCVMHCVTLPVFVKVYLPAEDDLQAECLAVEAVRDLSDIVQNGNTIRFSSLIIPFAEKV